MSNKLSRILLLVGVGVILLAAPARAQILAINVQLANSYLLNGDTWSSTVSPLDYTGTTWNEEFHASTLSASNLTYSNGTASTVGFSLGSNLNEVTGNTGPLYLLNDAEYNSSNGNSSTLTLTITGLQTGKYYDLYLPIAYNGGDGASVTIGSQTLSDTGVSGSSFSNGVNYVEFTDIQPVSNQIVATLKRNTGQSLVIFNGFQIAEVPEPSAWALMGLGAGVLLWRLRRPKNII